MSKPTKAQLAARDEAIAHLRELLRPGDTVYGIVRSVSRSGMSRTIDFYSFKSGRPDYLTGYVSKALGYSRTIEGALKVPGCGMDLVFHCVYTLGRVMYPDGVPCIGEGCPSNDHANGDRDYTPDGGRAGCRRKVCTCHLDTWTPESYPNGCSSCGCHRVSHVHEDGGYAFRAEAL